MFGGGRGDRLNTPGELMKMAGTKLWQAKVGPHGARVTVKERKPGGSVYLYSWSPDHGRMVKRSLGYSVRDATGRLVPTAQARAKREALALAGRILAEDRPVAASPTVRDLIDEFTRRELPSLKPTHRRDTRRELELLRNYFSAGLKAEDLSPIEWKRLAEDRGTGSIDSQGRRVHDPGARTERGPRTVARTLKTLRQVCRWAVRTPACAGSGYLLQRDPTDKLKTPVNRNPTRPRATDEDVLRMLGVAGQVHAYMPDLLLLATATGRRIGSILALRVGDWRPDEGTVLWRADSDKLGKEWIVGVDQTVADVLDRLTTGREPEDFVFPAPHSKGLIDNTLVSRWWRRCEDLAGIPHQRGTGWHSLRRRFATVRKEEPDVDVAYAAGWKGVHTMKACYQGSDAETTRRVVSADPLLRRIPGSTAP